jgi:hypothetical protein
MEIFKEKNQGSGYDTIMDELAKKISGGGKHVYGSGAEEKLSKEKTKNDPMGENNMADVGENMAEMGKKENGQKTSQAAKLTNLATKEGHQVGAAEFNEEGWHRGAKRSRGSGNNFFTLAEVEQKMQRVISHETGSVRRASDDTWRKKDQIRQTMGNSGDARGKRKMSEPYGRRQDELKKNYLKGGRMVKQTGVVIKTNKNGSGMAEAGEQPHRPQ